MFRLYKINLVKQKKMYHLRLESLGNLKQAHDMLLFASVVIYTAEIAKTKEEMQK